MRPTFSLRRCVLPWLSLVLILAPAGTLRAEESTDPVTRSRDLFRAAAEALQAGDAPRHLSILDEAVALRPGHPTLLYHHAAALCLNDRPGDAMRDLELLAAMGIGVDPSQDEKFASLAGEERFEAVLASFRANETPRMRAETAFRVPGPDLVPEGIAHDPRSGDFFLSSIRRRCILRVHDGEASLFSSPEDSLWSVMGLAVDVERGWLWAVTSALPQTADFDSADAGRAAVLAYDLRTGTRLLRFTAGDGDPHQYGDLALAPDGTVFISDGAAGNVVRFDPASRRMSPVTPPGSFASPQGLVLDQGGSTLLVADYSQGIYAVDPANGSRRLLSAPPHTLLMGIDGLTRHGRSLIAIQNGIRPHRVVRVDLDDRGERILGLEVLEAARTEFQEPTLGVVVGNDFLFVANSQWNRFNPDASLQTDPPLQDPLIMRISLVDPGSR